MFSHMTQHKYSHTQLAMWKRCKRLYHDCYMLGKKEPTTANMAAGTWLAQAPVETWEENNRQDIRQYATITEEVNWESIWANFLAEFDGTDEYDDPIFTLDLAKRILAAYKAMPVQGNVVEIERTYEMEFPGGYVYTSRPDFVVEHWDTEKQWGPGIKSRFLTTWDIKLKTFNQQKAGDTWFASSPLSPFDDQCLGQAILSGADAFGQIQFFVGKKDGLLVGPVYVEQPVNPVLAEEWKFETCAIIHEIDDWKFGLDHEGIADPWPKNSDACHAFGKDCHRLSNCQFGFEVPKHA